MEKVLLGEPWSFDCHLVVLQRFDGSKPIRDLEFKTCSFWVQIHDLPYQFMTPEAAVEIGETIGHVIVSRDTAEMKGGTFMRVRVTMDISRPLCRGRKICLMKIQRVRFRFNMNSCPIYAFGVGCSHMMTRTVIYG